MATRHIIRHSMLGQRIVWLIDSEQWPRACLRAELMERGYDVYGFIMVQDALQALTAQNIPKPDSLILELRDQSLTREGLMIMRSLAVPTIFLAGNPELNDPLIQEQTWSTVLRRPVSLGAIADLVQRLVPEKQRR